MFSIQEKVKILKKDSPKMAALSLEARNNALMSVAQALLKNKDNILTANKKDMANAEANGLASPILKRLKFDQGKLEGVIKGIEQTVSLSDPLFKKTLVRQLDDGLILTRETCPIGVIGIIFEARPDALVQISSLCIKSGNCAIIKGGSEAFNTNRVLFETIYNACVSSGLPEGCMLQAEQREEISQLLSCHDSIDLLIPRGSNSFVQYIMNNTKIPVMGHADGICHIYVHDDADIDKAINIIIDSKTQYVAVCNAVESLLVNKNIAKKLLPPLREAFIKKNVIIKGTPEVRSIIDCDDATDEDFETEYLDYIISIKLTDDIYQAVDHINKYGSGHTDCIITESQNAADIFMQLVDSAGVYHNCSTRFADGFRYGFGAEVGISTGKLHARGPVGLEGLVTYKYKLTGNGHIVEPYAGGDKSFNFVDLPL